MKQFKGSFDGACEPCNPGGDMGMGWVINDMVYGDHVKASPENTNNIAEYLALTRLLEAAVKENCKTISITGDSQLVIRQMTGEYAVKSASLRPYYQRAVELVEKLRKRGRTVTFAWVPRTENLAADYGARKALEAA